MSEQTSDFALGGLLAALGASVLAGGYAAGFRDTASAEFFPALLAACMIVVAVLLVAVDALTHGLPPFRWTWITLLVAFVLALALNIALAMYFARNFLLLGPAEYVGTLLMLLAMAVAFAKRSHLRALGMVLIGLLLSTAGIDIITGRMRFTFGNEALFDGFDFLVVAPAIVLIGEALLCLVSPRIWFSTFTRWLVPTLALGPHWPVLLRVLSAIAIVASLWLAWEVHHSGWDIVFAILFGLFGAACMLLGWNRLMLCFALFYGRQLEQSLRQSLVLAEGNLSELLTRPTTAMLLGIAVAMLAIAFALWLWRVAKLRRVSGLSADST